MEPQNVVVTGLGMVTAVGLDRDSSWEALKRGECGIAPLTALDASDFKTTFAGELKGFDPEVAMDPKDARKADRYAQIAVVAADQAMKQAGLDAAPGDPYRAGVIIGSGIGGMITFEEQHSKFVSRGSRGVSPLFIPMMISDMAAGLVSIRYGFRGRQLLHRQRLRVGRPRHRRRLRPDQAGPRRRDDHRRRRGRGLQHGPVGLRQHEGPVHAQRRSRQGFAPLRRGP